MTDYESWSKGQGFLKTFKTDSLGMRVSCATPRVLPLPVLRMDIPSVTKVRRRDALVRMRWQLQVVRFQSFIKGNGKTFKAFLMPLGIRCMTRVTSEMKMKKKKKRRNPPSENSFFLTGLISERLNTRT